MDPTPAGTRIESLLPNLVPTKAPPNNRTRAAESEEMCHRIFGEEQDFG